MGLLPGTELLDPKLIKPVLITVGVAAVCYFGYQWYHDSEQNSAQDNLDNSPEAQQANNLLKMLHPYSYKSFNVLTMAVNPLSVINIARDLAAIVDKNAIVLASKGIKNFDSVSKYYKQLTRDALNLPDSIREVLNDAQQKEFYRNISIAVNTKEADTEAPFYVYANPTAGLKYTGTFFDGLMKKPATSFPKGVKLGQVNKLITSPFLGKDGIITPIQLYYLKMEVGQNKGQYLYAVASQVSKTKPV